MFLSDVSIFKVLKYKELGLGPEDSPRIGSSYIMLTAGTKVYVPKPSAYTVDPIESPDYRSLYYEVIIDENNGFRVVKGTTVLIETCEKIELPHLAIGIIVTSPKLAVYGVEVQTTVVPPGYKGKLVLPITPKVTDFIIRPGTELSWLLVGILTAPPSLGKNTGITEMSRGLSILRCQDSDVSSTENNKAKHNNENNVRVITSGDAARAGESR